MRHLRWLGSILFLVVMTVPVGAQPACACKCASPSAESAMGYADLAFTGVVMAIQPDSTRGIQVTFAVESVRKGEAPGQVILTTSTESASCGIDFTLKHRYEVYAQDGRTGLCSGTRSLGVAAPPVAGLPSLPPITGAPPSSPVTAAPMDTAAEPVGSGQPTWWWIGGGALGLIALGLVLNLRRNRVSGGAV